MTEQLSLSAPPGKPLGSSIVHKNTLELYFPQRTAKEKRKRLNFLIDFYLLQENGRTFTKLESTFSGTVKTLGNTWLVKRRRKPDFNSKPVSKPLVLSHQAIPQVKLK